MAERLRCSKCGKLAACSCGAPYVTKLKYAAAHMDRTKSDGVNGKELGVSAATIRNARKLQPRKKYEVEAKRKGQDGKLRALPKKKKAGKIGRPRTDAYYSMRTANRLRGKARHAFMEEWAIRNHEKTIEQHPDLKWLHSLDETLRRFIALDKELHEGNNWRTYEITPCTFGLVPKCIEIMNGWLSKFQVKTEESKDVVHH